MESPESDAFFDGKRTEKSLSLLTRKFVSLLLSSKNGILDLKSVSASTICDLFHEFRVELTIERIRNQFCHMHSGILSVSSSLLIQMRLKCVL